METPSQTQRFTLYGLRCNLNLSAEYVAEALEISDKQGVLRYERDASKMNTYLRQKFADFYGVPVESIVFMGKDTLGEEFMAQRAKEKE